jgi:hypothetical protein
MVRIYYTYVLFYTTFDHTWIANRIWLWVGLEAHLGVICASAPALKAYFRKYFGSAQTDHGLEYWRTEIRRTHQPNASNRSSDEKSVMPKINPGSVHSNHEVDLENSPGIAITCDLDITSEHYPSMPSSPMSPRDLKRDSNRKPRKDEHANTRTQNAVPSWTDGRIPSFTLPGTSSNRRGA